MVKRNPPRAPVDALTGLEAARFGVYVHFPFCLSKCPYCDFASVVAKEAPQERYTQAVLRELELRAEGAGTVLDSVYFGGGTPSLWEPKHVARVLTALSETFSLNPEAEVTLETNPGAADAARFAAYRECGVNRLSIGVQSHNPKTLAALGRAHSPEEALRAYEQAREAGFDNVSLDFIYGVQGQTLEEAEADAEQAAQRGVEHLSAYALTLEKEALAEEVPLAKQLARGEVQLPLDEVVVEMQRTWERACAAAGLVRYEVSNYARPDFHSRHNALYWTGGEYLALGVGATGTLRGVEGAVRWSNQRSWEHYLTEVEAGRLPEASREPLDAETLARERLAMGLRLRVGLDVRDLPPLDPEKLKVLQRQGLLERAGGRVRLTTRGLDLHSAVVAELI